MKRLVAKELRLSNPTDEEKKLVKRNPLYIILDNVLDTYNIGAVFRLADAVAAEKVILCGETETPPNHRIKKASINTTEWVPWEYAATTEQAIQDLRSKVHDIQIVAVEQDKRSIHFQKTEYSFPIALIVGHETTGVSQNVLTLCDKIVEIPMYGINTSLNVMVSLGIVLFEVTKSLEKSSY